VDGLGGPWKAKAWKIDAIGHPKSVGAFARSLRIKILNTRCRGSQSGHVHTRAARFFKAPLSCVQQ
jgi:hypothetical protein